jgi:hypothetical protein
MATKDLSKDPKSVDVSNPETQYRVQCARVNLVSSALNPLTDDIKETESKFVFKITAFVNKNVAFSLLDVQVFWIKSQKNEPVAGYKLRFGFEGMFIGEDAIPPDQLADFVKMYTLSILWPYAREYTSDQFRRTGQLFDQLPVINPQIVTENLVKNNLITVKIFEEEAPEN